MSSYTVLDLSCGTTIKHECGNCIAFCIPWVAPCTVLEVNMLRLFNTNVVVALQTWMLSYIEFCIPEVAPRIVLDISCVTTIKHECRSHMTIWTVERQSSRKAEQRSKVRKKKYRCKKVRRKKIQSREMLRKLQIAVISQ